MTRFRVALTVDAEHPDRPHNLVGREDALLEQLGELDVRASFFIQGRWAEAFPDQARRIADAGHLIGNHSHYHARMHLLTPAGLREDLRTAADVIERICRRDPVPWFRSPFGAGASDPNVRDALTELGYRQVLWSASGDDWEPDKTPAAVEDDLVGSAIAHGDGAILLLHTWPSHTHATIRSTVARLRTAGAELVTLDALDPQSIPDRWPDEGAPAAADRPAT